MQDIAIILRFLQLYAHAAHNLTKGKTFFADHKFLGRLYLDYEEAFDSVIERALGLGESIDIQKVNKMAANGLAPDKEMETEKCFKYILAQEKNLCNHIKKGYASLSVGTQQLLGSIADDSEKRQYKLGQRLK